MKLLHCLRDIKDFSRAQAIQDQLPEVLIFIILWMLGNASIYRMTEMSVQRHLKALNEGFGIRWRHALPKKPT